MTTDVSREGVKALLEAKADPNDSKHTNSHQLPLNLALIDEAHEVVELLIQHKADPTLTAPNQKCPNKGGSKHAKTCFASFTALDFVIQKLLRATRLAYALGVDAQEVLTDVVGEAQAAESEAEDAESMHRAMNAIVATLEVE